MGREEIALMAASLGRGRELGLVLLHGEEVVIVRRVFCRTSLDQGIQRLFVVQI
jgi:hypothetical protein